MDVPVSVAPVIVDSQEPACILSFFDGHVIKFYAWWFSQIKSQ